MASFSQEAKPPQNPGRFTGTTLIAAEKTGRRCYAMELSAQYVDVAVRRWQQFTGKRAVLESTGEPFPDESIG